MSVTRCGDPGYERCAECQASRYEPHLDPCSERPHFGWCEHPDGPSHAGICVALMRVNGSPAKKANYQHPEEGA